MKIPKIDISQISEADAQNIGRTFLAAVLKYYENPENLKRYEEQKKRDQEAVKSE